MNARNSIISKKEKKTHELNETLKALSVLQTKTHNKKPTKHDVKKLFIDALDESLDRFFIRNPYEASFKSHNMQKQRIEFLKYVFCKYPVPEFMLVYFPYRTFNKNALFEAPNCLYKGTSMHESDNRDFYQDMFQIITTGGSLRQMMKGTMTAKECAIFLTLKNDKEISYNIWLSRLISSDVPKVMHDVIIDRFLRMHNPIFYDFDVYSFFRFLKKYSLEIIGEDLNEIMDYLLYVFRQTKGYTLNGRTLESVRRASNEWHKEEAAKKFNNANISWPGIEIENRIIIVDNVEYEFVELLNAKELYREGATQRHCVGSYVYRCKNGMSNIFSMRHIDGRITIEVSSNRVVQTRGKFNSRPNAQERKAICKWAEGFYRI